MQVKLCGFRQEDSLLSALNYRPDYVGFVFYQKSLRYISPKDCLALAGLVPKSTSKVAIVVNANIGLLKEIYQSLNPDYFQLHGSEDPNYISQVKGAFPDVKIIKAFALSDEDNLPDLTNYDSCCDLYLFDSKTAEYGGSGTRFDWNLLDKIETNKSWFLSGGINIDNIDLVLKNPNVKMVDISSGIEEERGVKSSKLISQIMQKIKNNAN